MGCTSSRPFNTSQRATAVPSCSSPESKSPRDSSFLVVCPTAATRATRDRQAATTTAAGDDVVSAKALLDARASSLQAGQPVRVRLAAGNRSGKWIPGRISHVCQQPNSYIVRTHDGRHFRRNRVAINVDRAPTAIQRQPAFHPPALPPHGLRNELVNLTPPVVPLPVPQTPTPSASSPVEGLVGSPFCGFTTPARIGPAPSEPVTSGTTRSGRSYLAPNRQPFPV